MKGFKVIVGLVVLLLLAPQLGFSQYKSFFGKEVTSSYRISYGHEHIFLDSVNILSSDTVSFNGNTYYRLTTETVYPNYGNRKYLHYVVREDTVYGRRYCYDSARQAEYLLVDMSLNKGDVFYSDAILDSLVVDSVYYIAGLKHIMFYRNPQRLTTLWIEGIGIVKSGFAWQIWWSLGPEEAEMSCMYKDQKLFFNNAYSNPIYPICRPPLRSNAVNDIEYFHSIEVFPNPAADRLSIQGINTGETTTVKIYDMMGRLQVEKDLTSNSFSIAHLSAGLYIFVLQNAQGDTLHRTQLRVEK